MFAEEHVESIPLPPELCEWLQDFTNQHFKPESARKVRAQSFLKAKTSVQKPTELAKSAAEVSQAPVSPPVAATGNASQSEARTQPTLEDVAKLSVDSDYSAFAMRNVDSKIRNAAMRKLFSGDPHFNVMDGLDVYIDDYSVGVPIPKAMLRQMVQARSLGLLDDELVDQDKPPSAELPTQLAANDKRPPPLTGLKPTTRPCAAVKHHTFNVPQSRASRFWLPVRKKPVCFWS